MRSPLIDLEFHQRWWKTVDWSSQNTAIRLQYSCGVYVHETNLLIFLLYFYSGLVSDVSLDGQQICLHHRQMNGCAKHRPLLLTWLRFSCKFQVMFSAGSHLHGLIAWKVYWIGALEINLGNFDGLQLALFVFFGGTWSRNSPFFQVVMILLALKTCEDLVWSLVACPKLTMRLSL